MSLAYLVNTYPSPTHTFIRREIEALEALGTPVQRFAIRRAEQAADGIHADEDRKVRHVLGAGGLGLARAVVRVALSSPATFLRALVAAVSLGRGSRQGVPLHLAYLAEACVLREWFGDAGIDHVHVHFGTNAVTVAQLCRRLGGPTYSFTVHGPEEFDSPAALKLGDKLADARFAVTISSYGKSQLQRWVDPDHWDRIHVVHCAVDESYLGRPVTPVPDVPRFCSVGRLAPQKGQLVLLDALARVRASGLDAELVLVGDGVMRPHVEAAIRRLDLGDAVRLTGWASNDEVAAQMSASRAVVMSSFAEGLPVVLMESFALGRPVITTAIAGVPELVVHRENGWLVPASDVDALVAAMREALLTPVEELTEMAKAGGAAVAASHRATTEAAKLQALFDRVS